MSDRINPAVRHPPTSSPSAGLRGEFRPSYRPEKPADEGWPDLRRIGVIAACCAGVLGAGAAVVTLFGHRHAGVPVIEAPAGPVRVKPADAGGMKLTGGELIGGGSGTQALAPPAEQPEINALKAQLHAVKQQLARQAVQNAETAKLAAASARIMASPPAAKASATLREPAPTPELPPPSAPPAAGVRVQLAAFTDAAAASAEWEALADKYPDLLARRRPEISRVQAAGRTMWRLRTGPFAGVTQATAFCATLHARGTDCSIAAF